jgi:hypothetical protein
MFSKATLIELQTGLDVIGTAVTLARDHEAPSQNPGS